MDDGSGTRAYYRSIIFIIQQCKHVTSVPVLPTNNQQKISNIFQTQCSWIIKKRDHYCSIVLTFDFFLLPPSRAQKQPILAISERRLDHTSEETCYDFCGRRCSWLISRCLSGSSSRGEKRRRYAASTGAGEAEKARVEASQGKPPSAALHVAKMKS
jgi:hypothetical protein